MLHRGEDDSDGGKLADSCHRLGLAAWLGRSPIRVDT